MILYREFRMLILLLLYIKYLNNGYNLDINRKGVKKN